MAGLADVTPLVLTFNEAPNIGRCLGRLVWAARIIVLDSGSDDGTLAIARRFPNVEIHTRTFDHHDVQWNHGLSLVRTPWVLALDADYLVPASTPVEARAFIEDLALDAVFARFRYCVGGQPLRGTLYPPRAVLFRPDRCRYERDGHTQRLVVTGRTATFDAPFDHDDRKPFRRWWASQRRYARLEAEKLRAMPVRALPLPDRMRKAVLIAPPAVLAYTLVMKGTMLDGWRGWAYAGQRALAETLLSWELVRRAGGGPGARR